MTPARCTKGQFNWTTPDMRVDAVRIWRDNDVPECRRLYRIFVHYFHGNFYETQRRFGWKRAPMLKALRIGKAVS